jgi:hypothetical protein
MVKWIYLVRPFDYQKHTNLGYLSIMTCQKPPLQSNTMAITQSSGTALTIEDTIFSPQPFIDDVIE